MSNVYTLKDINNRGHRLGSTYEQELEKKLRTAIDFNSEIIDFNEKLQAENSEYSEREKESQRTYADIGNKISQLNASTTKVRSQLISERKSHSESQRELEAKYTAEIQSLKSEIKTLKRKATLAQKASSADKIKILSLEVKIRELEGKLDDLELEQVLHDSNTVGGMIEEPAQINGPFGTNSSEIDSLRLELERANEDLNSKKHEIECMKKGVETSNNIFRQEIDALYSARSKLMEKNNSLRDQLALKKNNEVDTPPPPINNSSCTAPSSHPSTLNPSSQIISIGGAEAYLLRLYASWPGNGGIRGKKANTVSAKSSGGFIKTFSASATVHANNQPIWIRLPPLPLCPWFCKNQ
ncbi:hypothetical protein C1645_826988 [Glomus cerebriforme]|uniref:NUDE domain-containing protein n=1 Tax=Glomus cerebriforme TaxID=658196 RepID=A0A397SYK2_9GLOM|nr:hypothetical protein C1645_826988 [Glomus cerebriforme]